MAYFVPNFLLIIFLKSILVYQVPPTQKIAKTAENSPKIALFGTQIPGDWNRNRKIASREALKMLLTSQNHSTDRAYHLHGPNTAAPPEPGQKSKITKICVGVCLNLMSPTFLGVFLDVESDKKNRFKFWPLFHPPGPKQFFFYFAHIF